MPTSPELLEVMVNADTGKIESDETVTPEEKAAEQKAEAAAKKKGKSVTGVNAAKGEKGEKISSHQPT